MNSPGRILVSAFLTTLALACGGTTTPPGDGTVSSEINPGGSDVGGDKQLCDATPAPNARCAAACPNGYVGASGTHSCDCCAAPTSPDAGAGDVCGGPPPNARCMACPGGANSYKQINGQPTCDCCAAASPDAAAGDVCGGPPPNARCMACPGGANGYKQIDGQPTCECCSP